MKKVLFVTYGGGHVNIAAPIIRRLEKTKSIQPIVIGLTNAVLRLESENIPYYTLLDLLEGEDKEKAIEYGKKLAENYHDPYSALSLEDSIAYMGPSIYDLVLKHGEEEAIRLFQAHKRKAFYPTTIFKKVIEKLEPDLVITTASVRSEKAASDVAREKGIKTLRIIDLFGETGDMPKTDFIAVMNNFTKENLVRRGVSPKKIFITGQPAFESLFTMDPNCLEDVTKELDLDKEKPIITWASQKLPWIDQVADEIYQTFEELVDMQLIVKLHPSEDGILHKEKLEKYNIRHKRIIKSEISIGALLNISDLVITQFSTSGLESIFLDKPLITINLSGEPDILPYAKQGAALGVYSKDNLKPAVLNALYVAEYKRKLSDGRKHFETVRDPSGKVVDLVEFIIR